MSWIIHHFHAGRTGAALLVLRVIVGLAFIFHGLPKVADIGGFAGTFGLPWFLAAIAAWTEVLGGALLIVGLLTPLAALLLVIQMLTALFMVHFPAGDPFVAVGARSYELAAVYLCANVAFLLAGPGLYSLDAMLWRAYAERGVRPAPARERRPA
jgi:putative oxidoreductase